MSGPRQLYTQATSPHSQPSLTQAPTIMSYDQRPQGPTVISYDQPQVPQMTPQNSYPSEKPPLAQGYQTTQSYSQQPTPQQSYSQQPAPQQSYSQQPAPQQSYSQQPAPQQGMNPTGPPASAGKEFNSQGEREWSHGLFDCFDDCGTFCLGWWCPCFAYGQNKQRIDHLQREGRPDPARGGSGVGGDCCLYATLHGCCALGWVLQIGTRGSVRNRYKIRGDGCTDCLAAGFCIPCELTQEHRELQIEEGNSQQQY